MGKLSGYIASASLILFPGGILGVKYLSGAVFLMVFFAGLIQILVSPRKVFALSGNEKALFFSVCFLSISTFSISLFNLTELDRAKVFIALLMVVPIYIFFRDNLTTDKYLWIGLVLGTIIGLVVSIYQVNGLGGNLDRSTGVTNAIIFGDLALIMGVLAIAGFENFTSSSNRTMVILPLLALFSGLVASALSMARGGWIAIPVLFAVIAWYSSKYLTLKLVAICSLVMLATIMMLYLTPQSGLQDRVERTSTNIISYINSQQVDDPARATSIGTRLESWKAGWMIFLENPVVGGGWAYYQKNTQKLIDKGFVNQSAGNYTHPHNQFFSSLAKGGGIALIATVVLFLFPAIIFYRTIQLNTDVFIRNLGLVGLVFITGIVIFNLTESFLERTRPIMFYAFYLSVLFALIEIKTTKNENNPTLF